PGLRWRSPRWQMTNLQARQGPELPIDKPKNEIQFRSRLVYPRISSEPLQLFSIAPYLISPVLLDYLDSFRTRAYVNEITAPIAATRAPKKRQARGLSIQPEQ